MRRILHIFLFSFLLFVLPATQVMGQSSEAATIKLASKSVLKIFPNPNAIIIYNLVGRKIKKFIAEKGKSYPITDLPKGMYLIQLVDTNDKVITTQRMSKR